MVNTSRSKWIFFVLAVVFFILLGWAVYDFSSRTTFPGSKPGPTDKIMKGSNDTARSSLDSSKATRR